MAHAFTPRIQGVEARETEVQGHPLPDSGLKVRVAT